MVTKVIDDDDIRVTAAQHAVASAAQALAEREVPDTGDRWGRAGIVEVSIAYNIYIYNIYIYIIYICNYI